MKLAEYAKAATAFILAAYTGYQAARDDSSERRGSQRCQESD